MKIFTAIKYNCLGHIKSPLLALSIGIIIGAVIFASTMGLTQREKKLLRYDEIKSTIEQLQGEMDELHGELF